MPFRFNASTSDALSRPCERHAMRPRSSPGLLSAGKPRWNWKKLAQCAGETQAPGGGERRGGERRGAASTRRGGAARGEMRTRSDATGTVDSAARAASMQRWRAAARQGKGVAADDSASESKGRADPRRSFVDCRAHKIAAQLPRAGSTARIMRSRSRCAHVAPLRTCC
jgi:hypothetical protein